MPSLAFEQQPLIGNGIGKDLILELKNQFKSELKSEIFQELKAAFYSTANNKTNVTVNGNSVNGNSSNGNASNGESAPLKVSPSIPESIFTPIHHPITEDAAREVDGWFLQHWPFPDVKSRKKFVAAGFSTVTCLYFPKALNERIKMACALLTILFLIDGKKRKRFFSF
jgi:hypothetical protein